MAGQAEDTTPPPAATRPRYSPLFTETIGGTARLFDGGAMDDRPGASGDTAPSYSLSDGLGGRVPESGAADVAYAAEEVPMEAVERVILAAWDRGDTHMGSAISGVESQEPPTEDPAEEEISSAGQGH
ncbi:hypothetical protein CYMTET_12090 [Cymbomonas tetramitiformis]|uniref:Uncharacterized protein n=1 Tax=Cymbomonas tetramitiformis TaxID=36881 RepID=A0AAE0LC70_9CHLO|nr:hypothetical protein CYMTET_12090 [Cymbomonas tetramitiformis]